MKTLIFRSTIFSLLFSITVFYVDADVTKKVGPTASGGDYTTLKAAFDAINAGTIKTGVITLQIVGNTTETDSCVIKASGVGNASYTSVKIYPTGTRTITGTLAGAAFIKIYGANVTIDGSISGTGSTKDLTITNTSNSSTAGTYTISLVTTAHDVTVKNCVLKGSATSTSNSAVISLLNGSNTVSSYNNIITNNNITLNASAKPVNGILVSGTSSKPITGCTISNNNIYDFSSSGVIIPDKTGNTSGNTYSGNKIYQSSNPTSGPIIGFNAAGIVANEQFMGNIINISTTSSIVIKGFYFTGLSSATLANNVINLSSTGSSNLNNTIHGIHDNTTTSTTLGLTLFFNTIRISGSNGTSYCYQKVNSPKVMVRNNIFVNQRTGATNYVLNYNLGNTTNLTTDHNVFYGANGVNTTFGLFGTTGSYMKIYDAFWNASGESDSHHELPSFVDAAANNLHIQTAPISAVSGGGIPVSVTTDFEGTQRDDRFPDVGAFEYLADYYEFRGNTSPDLDNTWETTTNWNSRGIPSATDNVVIPDKKSVNITSPASSPAACNNLTILSATVLNLNPGKALTINGAVVNGGNITLQADSLTNSSLITNSVVRAKVERSMEHAKWELIASPIKNQDLSSFANSSENDVANSQDGVYYGFRDYNTSLNTWNDFFTDATIASYGILNPGQGYALLRTGTTITTTSPTKITFGEDTINVDALTVPVTRTGGNGWNCLGNPYTAPIALNENAQSTNNFLTINVDSLDPSFVAIYAWSDTSTVAYRIINNSDPASYLPVATGFFIKAKVSPGSVSFAPNMRVHQADVDFRGASNSWYGFDLAATTKSGNLSTAIKMNSKMTDGLDVSYDGGLMRMSNTYALYSRLVKDNGVDFAVQCVTDTFSVEKILPLGFDYSTGGIATFSTANVSLPDGVAISLEDRVGGVVTDLTTSGAKYQVNLPINTIGTGRFYIHLIQTNSTGISNLKDNSTIFVEANRNGINIFGNTGLNSTATIYDVNGKAKGTFNLDNSTSHYLPVNDLSSGIYILKIENQSTRLIKKFKL